MAFGENETGREKETGTDTDGNGRRWRKEPDVWFHKQIGPGGKA